MLIKGIESDLELLQIAYRNVEEDEKLALNEWKIALFVDRDFDKLVGFHFLRQKENGMWLHKQDFDGIINDDSKMHLVNNGVDFEHFNSKSINKEFAGKLNKLKSNHVTTAT